MTYEFQQFETIRSFGGSLYNDKSNRDDAEIDQSNLLENMVEFNNESGPKTKKIKKKILLRLWMLFIQVSN